MREAAPTCFIAQYWQPRTYRTLLLTQAPYGHIAYAAATTHRPLFSYAFFGGRPELRAFATAAGEYFLYRLGPVRWASGLCLEGARTAVYARAAGTFCRIEAINRTDHVALVRLPSGAKKVVSQYSQATRGKVEPDARTRGETRAGRWRDFGYKGHVRGIAKNAVDHPHGGRTKAIR